MVNTQREGRTWIIWITVVAVILAAIGIFFYYSMFKQSDSDLIELVPTDAVFVIEVNDNADFVSGSRAVSANLNDLFALDALPAFETIYSKISNEELISTMSGHSNDLGLSVLFNVKADKAAFRRLLRALTIDPNNYKSFEGYRIYTYGTNYKSMKFAFVNNVIAISEDVELLKRALLQQKHPKKLLSNKQFRNIFEITTKNRKQNWLIVNHGLYNNYLKTFFLDTAHGYITDVTSDIEWGAYQMRFSGNDLMLSGYVVVDDLSDLVRHEGDGFGLIKCIPAAASTLSIFELDGAKSLNRNLSERDNKLSRIFKDNIPLEFSNFELKKDSALAKYVAVLPDTTVSLSGLLYSGSDAPESVDLSSADGIYGVPEQLSMFLCGFCGDTMRFVTDYNGAFVFAAAKENLQFYKKLMDRNGDVSQNMAYKLISESVASTAVSMRALLIDKNNNFLTPMMSEKGKNSKLGTSLRAVSLSCNAPDNKYLPINIHLTFIP